MSRPKGFAPGPHRRQAGVVLLLVVAMVAVVSIAMASFGMMVSMQMRDSRSQLAETQALYITEAAVHRAIGHLQGVSNWKTASLPSPNPLSLTDSTNQAVISYISRSKYQVTLQAKGYMLARGYTMTASPTPPPSKVLDQATIQVTLDKVPTNTLWGYAIFADSYGGAFDAVIHGSMLINSGTNWTFTLGNGTGVYNDFTYNASKASSSLQSYLNAQNANALYASLKVRRASIAHTGSGALGTASAPLRSVGLRAAGTIDLANYYSQRVTVSNPGSFPTVTSGQINGTSCGSTDFRCIANSSTDPDDGCVWDAGGAPSDQSTPLSITLGGDVPSCTPYGSNGIIWAPASNLLTVNGTVFVDGNLTIGDSTYPDINYTGHGLIVANGNVNINAGLHPATLTNAPTTDMLSIIAVNNLTITPPSATPNKVVAGAFFSNNDATINTNTMLLGSVVAGNNVNTVGTPTFYQMPGLSSNLAPYMPTNGGNAFYISVNQWKVLI